MDLLQSLGLSLLGLLAIAAGAVYFGQLGAEILGPILSWLFGSKPRDPAIPTARRSVATVRTAFARDPKSREYRGKVTAQGEIWNACWADRARRPPPVGTEVKIVRIEGLTAYVELPDGS